MNKKYKRRKHLWFKALCGFLKIFVGKNKFIFLGEQFSNQAIILSNHVGARGPFSFEFNLKQTFRFWGTYLMNESLKQLYQYQTQIYYHQKKGVNIHVARLFCLIVSPLTYIFYRGLNLISTYPDIRLRHSFEESLETLKENQSIVIFPEDSSSGYKDVIPSFLKGFIAFGDYALKNGLDLPVYVCYLARKQHKHIVDAPIKFSELKAQYTTRDEFAAAMCARCNELGELARNNKI